MPTPEADSPRRLRAASAALLLALAPALAGAAELELKVRADEPGETISRHLYGQFAEHLGRGIYEGIWVGEDSPIPNTRGMRDDVLAALKELRIPVIRWPGGCFADEYDWRDGIGPRDERPVRLNKSWGWVPETNAFGTHEFLDLVEMLGSEAYIAGNVGSGSPREMAQWLEYMTETQDTELARLRRANGRDEPWRIAFFGVGNETWGCGGNMTPEHYADVFKTYSVFLKAPRDNSPLRIASGGQNAETAWTEALSQVLKTTPSYLNSLDGISHHYYTLPTGDWSQHGRATAFPEEEWISTLARTLLVDGHLTAQEEVLDRNDPEGRIGIYLDEWGTWYDPEPGSRPGFLYQQNTIRDAVVAALNFNIFHRHAKRLHMANIAQTVNVLQAVVLTDGEKMLRTPTYHAFEMYIPFQDATFVPVETGAVPDYSLGEWAAPHVSASAALGAGGDLAVALVNLHAREAIEVRVDITGFAAGSAAGRILTADATDAHNTFESPDAVVPKPLPVEVAGGGFGLSLPARSVSVILLSK
jgi:alpha-N-arabinofuranosidase